LHDVNLKVEKGEIVAIMGPNGTGKTVFLRTISGLLRPTTGSITFLGERIDKLPSHEIVKRGIAHCPERQKLFPEMTVMENLELGAYLRSDSDGIQSDLKATLELFPVLEERKNQMARTLSGGEQQMLTLGRALMSDPKLLMLDEPSMGLAPIIREKIMGIISEIRRRGVTVLLVEQDVALALSLCDRGYVFEEGTVFIEGTNAYLKGNPRVKEAYLGCN
jgi:branched-chain amino acid transport system ATP-binding protein